MICLSKATNPNKEKFMKCFWDKSAIIILMITTSVMFGCNKKKEIIQFPNCSNEIKLVGFANPALFSSTPGFHCFLNGSKINTMQIDCLLVFKSSTGNCIFIYKTENSNYVLADTKGMKKETICLGSVNDFSKLSYHARQEERFSLMVIDQIVTLNKVECVVFMWHSGGVKIYGFQKLYDGIEGLFSYKKLKVSDPQNTAFIKFTPWNEGLDDWPTIESIVWQNRK